MKRELTFWNVLLWWPLEIIGYITITLLKALLKITGLAFLRNSTVHGDAHWATKKEIKKAGLFKDDGLLVGKLGKKFIYAPKNTHVLAYGGTGSGKSSTVISNLLKFPERTFLVNDIKGEIYRETAKYRKKLGNRIIVLRPQIPSKSDVYDPLSFLETSTKYTEGSDLQILASLIIPEGSAYGADRHFKSFCQKLIVGVINHLRMNDPQNASLANALSILTVRGKQKRNAIFKEMKVFNHPLLSVAVNAFEEAGDREKGSFATTLGNNVAVWLDNGIQAISCTGELTEFNTIKRGWTWEDIIESETPTTIYIQTPRGNSFYYGAYIRMIFGLSVASIQRWYDINEKPMDRAFVVMADEAVTMGNCAALAQGVTNLRDVNCQVWLAFQSPTQVDDNYDDPRTIRNNCEWIIAPAQKDEKLYEEVSRLIGDTTIQNASKTKHEHGKGESKNEQARRLVKPDELRRMKFEEQVLIIGSMNIKCLKPFWWKEKKWKKM